MEPNTTRNYKDTVFSSLFYSCKDAVENAKDLYKALTGITVQHAEKCRLEDVVFREFKNDVAYIMDGKWICFIEHQSTVNPNMPLRCLIYAARTYERKTISGEKLMYSSKRITVPTPEFYVLYNGTSPLKETHLKLSDSFREQNGSPNLELNVEVININHDNLEHTNLKQCKTLYEYSYLIEKIREHQGNVAKAVKECIQQDVLADYLTFYGSEVINMLYTEYDSELAMQIKSQEEYEKGKAEGRAEGIAEGRAEGRAEGEAKGIAKGEAKGRATTIKQLLKNGLSADKIISLLEMSNEEASLYFGNAQTV